MILLFSGGLDSYIAWHYLKKPKTIYVNLNHRYADFEMDRIGNLVPNTIIENRLDLRSWEEPDANIPMRNAFLVLLAAKHLDTKREGSEVVLVVQKGEMDIPDRCEGFFIEMKNLGTYLGFSVSTPFAQMTKTDMVTWYLENVQDSYAIKNLMSTRSCYSDSAMPCGQCTACFRRWVAFTNNELTEEYENPILEYDQIPAYLKKMFAGKYDPQRTIETFRALMLAGYRINRPGKTMGNFNMGIR